MSVKSMVLGSVGTLVVLAWIGSSLPESNDDSYYDTSSTGTDAYLAAISPHMQLPGWTDGTLLDVGKRVCDSLTEHSGDRVPITREMVQYFRDRGFTDADVPQMTNDWALIMFEAVHKLCPEWTDSMPTHPGMPSG